MGVWDTVGALGIPAVAISTAGQKMGVSRCHVEQLGYTLFRRWLLTNIVSHFNPLFGTGAQMRPDRRSSRSGLLEFTLTLVEIIRKQVFRTILLLWMIKKLEACGLG
jgi:hypothetical protein